MVAVAVQHDALRQAFGSASKNASRPRHDFVVERIALLRPVEADDENVAALFGMERGRQFRQASFPRTSAIYSLAKGFIFDGIVPLPGQVASDF